MSKIEEFKGQAKRLTVALKELGFSPTHTQSLGLIARANGYNNWETAVAMNAAGSGMSELAALRCEGSDNPDHQWLSWLEAYLRMHGVEELDLDELCYDTLTEQAASAINNEGVYYQVSALLNAFSRHRNPGKKTLLTKLAEVCKKPELASLANEGLLPMAIPMTVSVLAGSRFEESLTVDCLEWAASLDEESAALVLEDGLSNSEESDYAALWLQKNSSDPKLRKQLDDLLKLMTTVQSQPGNENCVGLTVSIEGTKLKQYFAAMNKAGYRYPA